MNRQAAQELLTDRVENDELGDGFHSIAAKIGEAVGEVYLDYSGSPVEDFNA